MVSSFVISLAIIAVIVAIVIFIYNRLIALRNEVKNSFAQIDVQLKRRNDLIPNLIETVKGYAKHEKELFETVTKQRSAMISAKTTAEKGKASNMLSDTLKSIFAVAENYPDLKANQNFMQLQEELSGTENKIGYARQHFNDMVMLFNNKIQQFPGNIFAQIFKFHEEELFAASAAERKNVQVKF